MEANKIFSVKNRSAGQVVYTIPDENIRRQFAPGEVKLITFGELEKLSFLAGGPEIMTNFLQIGAEEATNELGIHREPEYNMSETQIIDLIRAGSLDEFKDALDFAPIGVIDLIKRFAIELPMTDYDKIRALKDKTGFDVATAMMNVEKEKTEEEAPQEEAPVRRVKKEDAPQRRTESKYKVVNKTEA